MRMIILSFLIVIQSCKEAPQGIFKYEPTSSPCYNTATKQPPGKYVKGAKYVFLVNESKQEIITFTVKISRDKGVPSETKLLKLYPGEQRFVDCDMFVSPQGELATNKFDITGSVIE